MDGLDPGDVFDLTQILIGELRALHTSTAQLDPEVQDRYEAWLATKETVRPGDVYHLVQHNLGIVRRLQSADEN